MKIKDKNVSNERQLSLFLPLHGKRTARDVSFKGYFLAIHTQQIHPEIPIFLPYRRVCVKSI